MTENPCQRLWQVEAARDGRLTGNDLANALRHRSGCAQCKQAAHTLDELGRSLKALPVQPMDQLAQKRARQALLGAWNEQLLAEPRAKATPRVPLIAAFSAIVGVALAIGYPRTRSASRASEPAVIRQPARPFVEPSASEPARADPSPPAAPLLPVADAQPAKAKPTASAKSRSERPKRAPSAAEPERDSAEDDAYLQIVYLLRSGREAEARAKASQYLVRFPFGFRRLEVEKVAVPGA